VFKLDLRRFATRLSESYPLAGILIGATLVSASIGPFHNIDTQLEFGAALGVVKWGMPFIRYGHVINQPPLAFYLVAVFLRVFSPSYDIGVAIVTVIGLGCTILVYKIGKTFYGKTVAIMAAALFAITPWHLAISRSFLIDVQCLFFSLLFLLVGIYAIRRDSAKLLMVSGILFAIALLTKFFAVFTLIPLTYFYFSCRQKKLKSKLVIAAYFLPALILAFLWYQVITGRGLLSAGGIDDFITFNPVDTAPSLFFIINFLLAGLGAIFLLATVLSFIISFVRRDFFTNFIPYDLMSLVTIVAVGSINAFLAVGLNLSAPYNNPIKYDYHLLPFFSLSAASLVGKSLLLFDSTKSKQKPNKMLLSIVLISITLLAAAIILNMKWVNQYSTWDHWLFKVESDGGYAFLNYNPISEGSFMINIQYLGFAFVLSGIIWQCRRRLRDFLYGLYGRVRLWIETKNALSYARRKNGLTTISD
jgi:4-amino-4-deoxy-L-arabinose transferase-like glycosyltransferase